MTLMEPDLARYHAVDLLLAETLPKLPSECAYSVVDEREQGLALDSEVLESFPINSFFCGSSVCLRGQELARVPSGPFHFVQVFLKYISYYQVSYKQFTSL